jgi:hypothetical protein
MDSSERTYSKSEIRERRRELSQRLALQQRQLDALAKMDEAADELDQVEREMEALSRGETNTDQLAETVPREPLGIGKRTLMILKDQPDTWLGVREVYAEWAKRGWMDGDEHLVMQRLRHCLPRLVNSNEHVERDDRGVTHLYRYRSHLEGYAPAPVPFTNGTAHTVQVRGTDDD